MFLRLVKPQDILLSTFLILLYCGGRNSLSNLRVSVPSIVLRGENTTFNCTWDTDKTDKIWAVKWYRGTIEIFRNIFDEIPPIKTFPLDNFHIDEFISDGKTLLLRNVNFHNTGEYSCEVIADQTFHTLIKKAHMQVVDLPDDKPRISGIKDKYQIGETIEAMCTSWHSHPPANLSWFINEEPARTDYLKPLKIREEYDETFTSVLNLKFEISHHHFRNGAIKLKCTSSLLTIYWQSSMVELHEASPRLGQLGIGKDETTTVVTRETQSDRSAVITADTAKIEAKPVMPVASLSTLVLAGFGVMEYIVINTVLSELILSVLLR
ncbi:uncharacterized protein LOC111709035 [Eurytemora carolleeae]|uniref:uncharacterized protein LOC111709035 n=1 Tax=Eurytemora carolleeae TaxID=1294199 RepID=UPI000C75BE26|nr:uncharacterized protein LOC111709035 [Eurytemora carolleeae]|eukprot:XP_023338379.1 uncharacterized protein LOC111709035 [Eurytemora affinis]